MSSSAVGGPSMEPYLRARGGGTGQPSVSLPPPRGMRSARTQQPSPSTSDDFRGFVKQLFRLASKPITVPLHLIHKALTSPLTLTAILQLTFFGVLLFVSAISSLLAVVAFWYSWRTGGAVEVEGWLTYGSKAHTTPHTLVSLPTDKFQQDLRYDVSVEMELVRPTRGTEEMSNFMLSLDLRAAADSSVSLHKASQPSLPPPALGISTLPSLLPALPCVIPYPFRFLCPSRVFGYGTSRHSKHDARRSRSSPGRSIRLQDVVLMEKDLMEGIVIRPTGAANVGSAFVSIGREDSFADTAENCKQLKEIRTTGWVIVRFTPRPTGIRWILASHPLPPLLILPPISLALTVSSALLAFLVISCVNRLRSSKNSGSSKRTAGADGTVARPMTAESMLEEKTRRVFAERDREERREAERRRQEWDHVEGEALGLRRMPQDRKRSVVGESTIGGSETTAPSAVRSFAPMPEWSSDDRSETSATDTAGESI